MKKTLREWCAERKTPAWLAAAAMMRHIVDKHPSESCESFCGVSKECAFDESECDELVCMTAHGSETNQTEE